MNCTEWAGALHGEFAIHQIPTFAAIYSMPHHGDISTLVTINSG